jgi:hypothetical protein
MVNYTGMNVQTVLPHCIQLYLHFSLEIYIGQNFVKDIFILEIIRNGMVESVGTSFQTSLHCKNA